MRGYNFPQLAASILLPGDFLEAFLGSILENSVRKAMGPCEGLRFKRSGKRCQRRQLAASSRKAKSRYCKKRHSFCRLRNGSLLQHDGCCARLSGNAEQRAACTPDAFRLCAGYIPEASKVELCLRQQKSALSEACRSVFEQNTGAVVTRSSLR